MVAPPLNYSVVTERNRAIFPLLPILSITNGMPNKKLTNRFGDRLTQAKVYLKIETLK